jgi:hypothetical protein
MLRSGDSHVDKLLSLFLQSNKAHIFGDIYVLSSSFMKVCCGIYCIHIDLKINELILQATLLILWCKCY